ncbi:HAD family hydrolase [Vibrio palustris]|uniref:2-deoxyglucose-6-phosphate phosphatase n=1 Tax=Vibrio palustris TaxID=1918946 RepID=A0A1R4B4P9_9VIBR|nr:HAD-IA family hydrolase [Vibrio palustris]SJL83898.1 2-deoxyglucose-6-phosphate phosphatase [Vibrio palustris]
MKQKAVIFDMDGVLIDSEPLWQEAQIDTLKSFNVHITRHDCEELTMGKRLDDIAQTWLKTYTLPVSVNVLAERILGILCDRIVTTGKAMTGVKQALDYFTKQEMKIALATSSHHLVIKAVFDRLKLHDKFSVVCSAEDEQKGKPAPDVYLTAAYRLQLPVHECVVIEDSLTGLTAAKTADMTTYLVSPQHKHAKFKMADYRYANLLDLIDDIDT